jgi:ATP-dependent RNA helicase DHX8/PRP22
MGGVSLDDFDETDRLQYLSLVSKVCRELNNHLSINDRDTSEFIIDLALENRSPARFARALGSLDLSIDEAFLQNLYTIITKMMPKTKQQKHAASESTPSSSKPIVSVTTEHFPGLSMPDSGPVALDFKPEDEKKPRSPSPRRTRSPSPHSRRARMSPERRRSPHSRRSRSPRRDRSPDHRYRHRARRRLELYEIYDGRVNKIMDFGAFITLEGANTLFFRRINVFMFLS